MIITILLLTCCVAALLTGLVYYRSKYWNYLDISNKAEADLVTFDKGIKEKIQALFNNYYISQDDLSTLVARNIITKQEADDFAKQIATHEQYESIFALDDRYIKLTRETDGESHGGGYHPPYIPGGHLPSRASQIKNDPELQELLLSQIGFDERTLVLQGTNNSLDGYRIYPSEDYGVMVFLKNDKPGNATYIMSLQQGMYFLNKIIKLFFATKFIIKHILSLLLQYHYKTFQRTKKG